jgi:thioredoxin 1
MTRYSHTGSTARSGLHFPQQWHIRIITPLVIVMFASTVVRRLVTRKVRFASNYVVLGSSDKLKGLLEAPGSKILYFTATWCPPCKKIAPSFEKMSNEFAKTTFVKIDIDDHRDLAEEYGISAVPTFKAVDGTTVVTTVS